MAPIVPAGKVVFGMQLPVQAQSKFFVEPWEIEAGPTEMLEVAKAADESGFFYVGVCDHVAIPDDLSPKMSAVWYDTIATLGWLAGQTSQTRLLSTVFNLAYRHPLVSAKSFATLDLLSGGRAEIMAGRGSFIESFPLFGYDLEDYDDLFSEKLLLLLQVRARERVTWHGRHRADIDDLGVYPRPVQRSIPVWIAVGGNPESAIRAGTLGLPMALAIIGGRPERFAPFAKLHREAALRVGFEPPPPMSINSHGFIAPTSQEALDLSYPGVSEVMNRIGRERGWAPMSRADFEASAGLRGANFVGGAQQVIEKILHQHEIFGHDRFLMQLTVGTLPHEKVMRAIELFGTEVAPVVRREVAVRRVEAAA
jgi:alkanesulfonate monooxygenase SsuD/methylene tetrahydromethanopterin reductase-like flavin-dependent oxidoreductase (luciferase family)